MKLCNDEMSSLKILFNRQVKRRVDYVIINYGLDCFSRFAFLFSSLCLIAALIILYIETGACSLLVVQTTKIKCNLLPLLSHIEKSD